MKPSDIIIRTLSPDEWAAYKAFRLEALQNAPHAFGSSYAETVTKPDAFWKSRLEAAQEHKDNWLFFAQEDGRLIGLIGAFTEKDVRIADVVSVYVTPSARGRGVSKNLMAVLLDELAKSEVLEKARLTVNRDQLPAVSLYKRFGFEIIAEEEAIMGDGNFHTEFIMEKLLER